MSNLDKYWSLISRLSHALAIGAGFADRVINGERMSAFYPLPKLASYNVEGTDVETLDGWDPVMQRVVPVLDEISAGMQMIGIAFPADDERLGPLPISGDDAESPFAEEGLIALFNTIDALIASGTLPRDAESLFVAAVKSVGDTSFAQQLTIDPDYERALGGAIDDIAGRKVQPWYIPAGSYERAARMLRDNAAGLPSTTPSSAPGHAAAPIPLGTLPVTTVLPEANPAQGPSVNTHSCGASATSEVLSRMARSAGSSRPVLVASLADRVLVESIDLSAMGSMSRVEILNLFAAAFTHFEGRRGVDLKPITGGISIENFLGQR